MPAPDLTQFDRSCAPRLPTPTAVAALLRSIRRSLELYSTNGTQCQIIAVRDASRLEGGRCRVHRSRHRSANGLSMPPNVCHHSGTAAWPHRRARSSGASRLLDPGEVRENRIFAAQRMILIASARSMWFASAPPALCVSGFAGDQVAAKSRTPKHALNPLQDSMIMSEPVHEIHSRCRAHSGTITDAPVHCQPLWRKGGYCLIFSAI
jgi:hypothetical protein